jgi:hypothetical protein
MEPVMEAYKGSGAVFCTSGGSLLQVLEVQKEFFKPSVRMSPFFVKLIQCFLSKAQNTSN